MEINKQDIINFWCLEFATSLVKMKRYRWYWSTENTYNGLLGNNFFKRTMSYSKFQLLRRAFQADICEFREHFNSVNKQYWSCGNYICIDDDLDKCESRTKERLHKPRKR